MPFLYQYLIKLSISLAVLYTFYYVVLRPLTFHQWNRFYLACYSLLSFIIPFINVTDWLTSKNMDNSYFLNSIPAVDKLTNVSFKTVSTGESIISFVFSWNFAGMLFVIGALVMTIRIAYQYLSLRAMKRKAVLLKTGEFEFYDVNGPIAPFSFANAIFINSRLHSEEEFHKILEHEFVHVKQKHTVDIIVAELLCVVNWFNPFAWLIRKAIRQNLEFIADNNVLEGGIDPRQYQYLLLKVMGLPQYTITNNFNFSSLKKRITMMNKMRTAKVHLVKFLFVLPLLSVLLLAFRDRTTELAKIITYNGIGADTIPKKPAVPAAAKTSATRVKSVHPVVKVVPDTPVRDVSPNAPLRIEYVTEVKVNVTQPKGVAVSKPASPASPAQKSTITEVRAIKSASLADTTPTKIVLREVATTRAGQPLYVVDGEVWPAGSDLKTIDPNTISEINVLKDAFATEKYGLPARNGVIEVRTKYGAAIKSATTLPQISIRKSTLAEFQGLIILDGKEVTMEKFETILPDTIESITVLKDSSATAIYNEKGKRGVLIIKTKKQ